MKGSTAKADLSFVQVKVSDVRVIMSGMERAGLKDGVESLAALLSMSPGRPVLVARAWLRLVEIAIRQYAQETLAAGDILAFRKARAMGLAPGFTRSEEMDNGTVGVDGQL